MMWFCWWSDIREKWDWWITSNESLYVVDDMTWHDDLENCWKWMRESQSQRQFCVHLLFRISFVLLLEVFRFSLIIRSSPPMNLVVSLSLFVPVIWQVARIESFHPIFRDVTQHDQKSIQRRSDVTLHRPYNFHSDSMTFHRRIPKQILHESVYSPSPEFDLEDKFRQTSIDFIFHYNDLCNYSAASYLISAWLNRFGYKLLVGWVWITIMAHRPITSSLGNLRKVFKHEIFMRNVIINQWNTMRWIERAKRFVFDRFTVIVWNSRDSWKWDDFHKVS
jgi:hypothetical protein